MARPPPLLPRPSSPSSPDHCLPPAPALTPASLLATPAKPFYLRPDPASALLRRTYSDVAAIGALSFAPPLTKCDATASDLAHNGAASPPPLAGADAAGDAGMEDLLAQAKAAFDSGGSRWERQGCGRNVA